MQLLFSLAFFPHHGHVDLKGEFYDLFTVPHQENIFAPRSPMFVFFTYMCLFPHSCEVAFLTALKYNQAFET